MSNNRLTSLISSYFQDNPILNKDKLVAAVRKDFPEWSDSTINIRISELKKEGIVQNPSRGVYTISKKPTYTPEISSKLKKLYSSLNKQLPYASFCVWNSKWLNEFMRHQPFHFYQIVEVEKDAMESAFNIVSELYSKVYLDPGTEIFELYISKVENPLIIKQLVSESPIEKIQNTGVPKLEKLLIDILIDENLFGAQQNEVEFIYQHAIEKYRINRSMMKRYAKRRNRESMLLKLFDKISAKNG